MGDTLGTDLNAGDTISLADNQSLVVEGHRTGIVSAGEPPDYGVLIGLKTLNGTCSDYLLDRDTAESLAKGILSRLESIKGLQGLWAESPVL